MIYVSTSRKPVSNARILAHWVERLLGGEYENRGKRSVNEIAERMEEKGFQKAVFIYERHGNPFSLNFFDRDEGRLYPEIVIGGYSILKKKGERVRKATSALGEDRAGKRILE